MGTRGSLISGVVALGALALPGAAHGATFCVQDPGCTPQLGGSNQPTIQDAINAAGGGAFPGLDRVEVGPGPFAQDGISAGSGNPIELIGDGQGSTTITRVSTGAAPGQVINLADPSSSISDLTIRLNESSGSALTGLVLTGGEARRITTADATTGISHTGVLMNGADPAVLNSTIGASDATGSFAVRANASSGVARLQGSRLVARSGIQTSGPLEADRVAIDAGAVGVTTAGALAELDQVSIRLVGPSSNGLFAAATPGPTASAGAIAARHVTVQGPGSGTGAAVNAYCDIATGIGTGASIGLRNVILRGFQFDLARAGYDGGGACIPPGAGTMFVAYSIYDPAKVSESGPGTISEGGGNQNVDPQFVDAANGNLRLLQGSPAIDTGDPVAPGAGELTVDLDGNPRTQDGNGDGTAIRDIGAFEHAFVPPGQDGGGDGSGDGPGNGDGTTFDRRLTLGYSDKSDSFKGALKSTEVGCRTGKVKVYEQRKGKDPKVGSDKTNAKGKWSFEEKGADGTFFAEVAERKLPGGTCPKTTSKKKRV